jgi:hypothetical protein
MELIPNQIFLIVILVLFNNPINYPNDLYELLEQNMFYEKIFYLMFIGCHFLLNPSEFLGLRIRMIF